MDPATIAAAWTAGSAIVGGMADVFSARSSRKWQERMANTAWQRGVEDMRRAGLNPMLAFQQGPAQTPSGFMAQPGRSISEAGGTASRVALESKMNQAAIEQMRKQGDAAKQQGDAAESQAVTRRGELLLQHNIFNRETTWLQVQRELERRQREADIAATGSSKALTDAEKAGVESDNARRLFEAKQIDALDKSLEGTFGKGKMGDAARILLDVLRGGASSAYGIVRDRVRARR